MNYLLTINNRKKAFFLQLMKQFDFVEGIREIRLTPNQLDFIADFEESIEYLKSPDKGEKKYKTAQELLDEL